MNEQMSERTNESMDQGINESMNECFTPDSICTKLCKKLGLTDQNCLKVDTKYNKKHNHTNYIFRLVTFIIMYFVWPISPIGFMNLNYRHIILYQFTTKLELDHNKEIILT